jgi:hypothetical protein
LLPKPAYPTHPHPLGTIFAGKNLTFLYISLLLKKLKNKKQKINQTIERVALEGFSVFFSVAFRLLFCFLTAAKNCVINKPRPDPTLDPPHHQTVEIQALNDTNQTLETQALDKVPSKLNNALRFF